MLEDGVMTVRGEGGEHGPEVFVTLNVEGKSIALTPSEGFIKYFEWLGVGSEARGSDGIYRKADAKADVYGL